MRKALSWLALGFLGFVCIGLSPSPTFAADAIWPTGNVDFSPCTLSMAVFINADNTTPFRELHFSFRIVDASILIDPTESQFTGQFLRGHSLPDSAVDSVIVRLSPDSTIADVGIFVNQPVLVGQNAELLELDVLAETRHEFVDFEMYPESWFSEVTPYLVDSLHVDRPLGVSSRVFQSVFDIFPPPPNENVSGEYLKIKRMRQDTVVTMTLSYFAMFSYESMSLPIRVKATGVSAYVVPGSVQTTSWADPPNHLSHALAVFPDSTGFWLQLFDGPHTAPFWNNYQGVPIVQFDIAISGDGPGTVMVDTAIQNGARPYEFVDYCPDYFKPEFGHGWIDVGAVDVSSDGAALPVGFDLTVPYPNPFNSATTIGVRLPEAGSVHLEVVNLLGQVVERLWDGALAAGAHEFTWNAAHASSGLYFVRAQTARESRTAKLLLLK